MPRFEFKIQPNSTISSWIVVTIEAANTGIAAAIFSESYPGLSVIHNEVVPVEYNITNKEISVSITDGSLLLLANTENLSINNSGDYTAIKISSSSNISLGGVVPYDPTKCIQLIIFNTGDKSIILLKNSANSSANNRFLLNGNITLQSNEGLTLMYDPLSLRWRSSGKSI